MFSQLLRSAICNIFIPALRCARGRHGGVALIFALAAPMLIAITGLTVDTGYWYQQQESLQSAADGAVLAAARGAAKASITTLSAATTYASGSGLTIAQAAANNATNSQFHFGTSGAPGVTLSVSSTTSGTTTTMTWVATATIPRGSFLSRVRGLGLSGLGSGTQSATASAAAVMTSGSYCAFFNGDISVTGGATVEATNCGLFNADSTCPSITVTGSGKFIGVGGVATEASCVSAPAYSGYIGTSASGTPVGNTSTVTLNAAAQTDPLASMNSLNTNVWAPSWSTPAAPTESGSAYTPTLGWNTWTQSGVGDCLIGGSYSAKCELYPNYLKGMNSVSAVSLLLNEGTSSGQTYIINGFTTNITTLTLNGNNYYIDGGFNPTVNGSATASSGSSTVTCGTQTTYFCLVANGGTTLSNGSFTFPGGVYYFTGPLTSGSVSGLALSVKTPSLTIGASTGYFNGGILLSSSNATVSFGTGTYFFNSYNSSTPALDNSNASITFSGGTYFFNGGLTVEGNGTVNFGPGIYYIENGNLTFQSGSHITATGATFVLENGAGYQLLGGSSALNLTAPTSNCVSPANYPLTAYTSTFPYDGTNGEGICGISIYQARNDTTADGINEGATSSINGAIYSPSASLTISGGASLTITSTDIPALEAASLTDSGSGNLTLTENSSSSSGGGGVTSSSFLLIN